MYDITSLEEQALDFVLVSAIDLQIKLFIAGQHQLVPREQSSNHIITKQYRRAFGVKWEEYSNFAI